MSEPPFAAFVRRFVRGLGGARDRDRIVAEVLDHLEQTAAAEEAAGADPESARLRAMERFGDAQATAAAFPEARWVWLPALIGLLAALVLVVMAIDVAGEVARPCGGARHVFCTGALRLSGGSQVHPLRAKLDIAAAVSAAILAAAFAVAGWRQRRRREHVYRAAIAAVIDQEMTPATPVLGTSRRSVRMALWSSAGVFAVVILVAIGAGIRGATVSFATPREHAFQLQRGHALPTQTPRVDGEARARPLLRWILQRMPAGFATIGVKSAAAVDFPSMHGNVLDTTGPAKPLAGEMTEVEWETDVIWRAYNHYQRQPRWSSAPLITAFQSDEGGTFGTTWLRYYTPPNMSALRATIVRNARRAGLTPITIELPNPDGVAPLVILRTPQPLRYIKQAELLLPQKRFIGSLVMIEGKDGYVRVVLGSDVQSGYTWMYSQPRHPTLL